MIKNYIILVLSEQNFDDVRTRNSSFALKLTSTLILQFLFNITGRFIF